MLQAIPESDVAGYGLEVDKTFVIGVTRARYWMIDRERGMYQRNVAHGGGAEPELRNRTIWTFYWPGELLTLRLDLVDGRGEWHGALGHDGCMYRSMMVKVYRLT